MIVDAAGRPEVSVLVVTYQSEDDVDACLASLPAAVGDHPAEVVVVDNASTDASADHVAAHPVASHLIRNTTNTGFAAAVNQAARAASAPWLLLLNPDTECRPRALAALLEFAERHPEHGLYGGRTVKPDGGLDHRSCWGAPTVRSLLFATIGLSTLRPRSPLFDPESLGHWQRDTVREVDSISGCLLLVRASDWQRLGGFDERYWVYGEDLDLCTRARALGLHPVITPAATVVHAVGASSSSEGKTVLVTAGRLTWVMTHWRGPRRFAGVWLTRAAVGVRAGLAPLTGRGGKWRGAWRRRAEWWDGFPPASSPRPPVPVVAGSAEHPCT